MIHRHFFETLLGAICKNTKSRSRVLAHTTKSVMQFRYNLHAISQFWSTHDKYAFRFQCSHMHEKEKKTLILKSF